MLVHDCVYGHTQAWQQGNARAHVCQSQRGAGHRAIVVLPAAAADGNWLVLVESSYGVVASRRQPASHFWRPQASKVQKVSKVSGDILAD